MRCAMRKLDGTELNGRKLRLVEDYRGRRKRLVRKCYVCSVLIVVFLSAGLVQGHRAVDVDPPGAILVIVVLALAPVVVLAPGIVLVPGIVPVLGTALILEIIPETGLTPSHTLGLAPGTRHLV